MINTLLQRIFAVVALGILLVIIGTGVENEWTCLVGSFLFAAALFWGGLFAKEESVPIRVAMIAVAGLAVYNLISPFSLLSMFG